MLVLFRVFLVLVLLAASPAAISADETTVDMTFRLTLHGDVPTTDTFSVSWSVCTPGRACAGTVAIAVICGTGEDPIVPTPGRCKGEGTVYSETFTGQRGERAHYALVREQADQEGIDVLLRGERILTRDTTISASYRYPANGDQQGGHCKPGADAVPEEFRHDPIGGCVTDEDGNPIDIETERDVSVVPLSPPDVPFHLVPTEYPELGRYAHPRLFSGRYKVTVRVEGYKPASKVVEYVEGQPVVADFVLQRKAGGDERGDLPDSLPQTGAGGLASGDL